MAWVNKENLQRFYTKIKDVFALKTEVNDALAGKSDTSHTHDDMYYTESEVDTKVSNLQSQVDTKANASALGTQCTYTLNGTTLNITTKQ